jgi:hypothetical protein
MMELLKTLLWVADQNAAEVRENERSRGNRVGCLTARQIEEHEWRGMQQKLSRRQRLLGDALESEDDDGEALTQVVTALAQGKGPLTTFEVMRHLQRARLLSVEFPAAAKAQTTTLLGRLRVANRVWQDQNGRWSLF